MVKLRKVNNVLIFNNQFYQKIGKPLEYSKQDTNNCKEYNIYILS